jgi:chromosome segregation ATPase
VKAQTLLPWILAAGLAAGGAALFMSGKTKDDELTRLRQENSETQTLRTELEDTRKQIETQSNEVVELRKDRSDLLRLRNENRQLQRDKEQLSRQVETAQGEVQRVQAQVTQASRTAQATAQQLQQMQQLQTENQQLRTQSAQSRATDALNACINNLRQIDGAKQQWALENSKTADAIPQPQDIVVYLGRNGVFPTCPAGGTYTINAVNQEPTCSTPGHALPRPK